MQNRVGPIFLTVVIISLCLSGCSDPKQVILGRWTNSNGLDTLEFDAEGNYSIRNEEGKVGKTGKYLVIDSQTLEWEHTEPLPSGHPLWVIKGHGPHAAEYQVIGQRKMLRKTIQLSAKELVIGLDGPNPSSWLR